MASNSSSAMGRSPLDAAIESVKAVTDKYKQPQSIDNSITALSEEIKANILENFIYVGADQRIYEQLKDGRFEVIKDEHLKLKLKQDYGLSSKSLDPLISPVQQAVLMIREQHRCDHILSELAGYKSGIQNIGGKSILIKNHLNLMKIKEGSFDYLFEFLRHFFEDPHDRDSYQQLDRFLTWLQHAYRNANYIYNEGKTIDEVSFCGLALVLCGKPRTGKTFLVNLLTEIFGKKVGYPFNSLSGKTQFNSDWASAIHLSIDDEVGSNSYNDRKIRHNHLKILSQVAHDGFMKNI